MQLANGRKLRVRLAILFVALSGLLGAWPALAQAPGALGVSPTNILFDGRERSVEVTLINRSTQAATYRISFQNLRQTANGDYQEIARADDLQPLEKPAESLLRYSPRQVTVEPGKPQSIRVMLRKPADLPAGEYRSHLLFQQLPPPDIGQSIEPNLEKDQVSVKLIPLVGVSIPVIVREGQTQATAKLVDARIAEVDPEVTSSNALVEVQIHREGNASVRGDLEARFVPAGGGAPVELGLVRGLSVLYPNEARIARLGLKVPEGMKLSRGTLQLAYRAAGDGDKRPVLASSELSLP